jgi:2-dehydropantoate 2-reductase
MGCLFSARLEKAGFDVTLLDYDQERATLVNKQGVIVEGILGEYSVKVRTIAGKPKTIPDLVMICVKSYKTREAGESVVPMIESNSKVLTLQNGIGNIEILEDIFGSERVLGGVTAEGATLLGPGRIRHAGQGETIVGPSGGPDSVAEKTVLALNKAGFKSRSEKNVQNLIWGKLIINVGINALTAITGLKNGRLPEFQGTKRVLIDSVKEAVAVAEAKGVELPYPDPIDRVIGVCQATAGNIASMLQDVLKRRMTEIGSINGAIVREGELTGVPTPINRTLTGLVQTIQESYTERV